MRNLVTRPTRKTGLDGYRKDDRAVVVFHYRDSYGRRRRHGRWITHIAPWPLELNQGVKLWERGLVGDATRQEPYCYEVAAIGWEGFHLVVDLRKPTRPPGCVTGWTELHVGWNVVTKDEPWLSRDTR